MRAASAPFRFMAASTLTRITGRRASTLLELLDGIRHCDDASIFNHTFQSLEEHHFLTEGFSNDFAQWALAACNEPLLGERLASLDVNQYETLADVRTDLVKALEAHLRRSPAAASRQAFEAFHFCEALTVAVPTQWEAWTLSEFCDTLRQVSVHTVYYHFVTARLREPLALNDFSFWVDDGLGLRELGDRIDRIDIYTNTLDGVRQRILEEAARWLAI